ncbi:hypothetical protein Halxa_3534 [Halopiger xanaduensis SH-6]|uniref:CARDB domain-containing protein n=1 Tax=Halopiger xanaduensis (strain DSM 18323 / JCM 14033 / SH-6) TaxID=797210 RepID=F8DA73_HALXS|nr:hypothetical protein Halxa_3534 [Halopiger xanaduensis SH-6]
MYVTSIIRALIGSLPSFLAELGVPTARLRGRHLHDRFSSSSVSAVLLLSLLSLVIVGGILLGGITGIGTGTVSEPADLSSTPAVDADTSIQPAVLESTSQRPLGPDAHEEQSFRSVAFSQPNADTPDEDDVVVRLEDDHVVTAAVADRMPSDPYVETVDDGDHLIVDEESSYDYPVVQTKDGTVATVGDDGAPIARINNGTDLVVLSDSGSIADTIVVDRADGFVKTEDGRTNVTVDGTPIKYPNYKKTEIHPTIQNVTAVNEGETIEIAAAFEKREWGSGERDVTVRLLDSGSPQETVTRTIEIGDEERISEVLEYETKRGDHTADEIELTIDGNSDAEDVSIGAAGAAVVNLETRGTVEGDALEVTAELDRFGTVPEGKQDYPITLSINGTDVRTNVVTLAPDATTTETFTYEADRDDVPQVDVRVSSPTDSASTTVPVLSRLEHDHNIRTEVTDTTIGGLSEEFDVSAVFWYSGDLPGGETQFTANLTADGTVVDQQDITLSGSSAANATFTHELSESAPPIANATIETPADVTPVELDQETVITFDEITDPAARNGQLTATVTVENQGETPGTETLTIEPRNPYAVESDGTYTASAPLEPSESFTETVTFDVTEDAPPNLDLVASTTHASEMRTVQIRDNESRFEIENVSVDAGADGTNPVVTATIRNTGGAAGTQDATLTFDDESIATESVSLEPDEKRTLSGAVEPAETGTYSYGVTTDDDSVRDTTTVEPAADDSSGIVGSVQDTISLNGSRLPLLAASLLGVVLVGAVVVGYRTDSDDLQELQERMTGMTALQPAAQKLQQAARNARNLVSNGGSGSVVVQNGLPRTALIRVRVRSDEEILFLEDFELAEDEQRTLECLPDADQFEVGAGVDDIAAHEETFQRGTAEVGVVLQPDGITITAL